MSSAIMEAILKRRSIRQYTEETVSLEDLRRIITAGIWAPSGLNNQPWRFVIIRDKNMREELAGLTHYSHIVRQAPALIAVYLDSSAMYDTVKDQQSAGACIQNMLLAAESLGLGAVWLGQILKNKTRVNEIFQLDDGYDLMAVIAMGHPADRDQKSHRKPLDEFILGTY